MNMGTINEVTNLANELMAQDFEVIDIHGNKRILNMKKIGYKFEYNHAKRAFGKCYYTYKKISLSLELCKENLDKIHTNIRNTILHEIAHAFSYHIYGREGMGHDFKWQKIAIQIGCDGKRCYDGEKVNLPKSKYSLVCDNCEKSIPKHKIVKKKYACSNCCNKHNNGRYSDEFRLKLVQNY